MSTNSSLDAVERELFRNSLDSIVDEMALTIFRTAYSNVIRDVMDAATALCDPTGQTIAQGLTIPVQLGAMPDAMNAVITRFGDTIQDGDVFIMNDPYEGGMHLPDIFVMKPVFDEDVIVGWACTICHHTDVGGRVAGSNAADSTEIYQEGLRIPPTRLYSGGEPNSSLFGIIEKNVRAPEKVFGDLRSQLAACHVGEERLLQLVHQMGRDVLTHRITDLLDSTEAQTRAAIKEIPDGKYEFTDFIDDDGVDLGVPIKLHVTVTVEGDRINVDWTGSSKQVRGAINSTFSYTKGCVYVCVKSSLSVDIPCNEGFFRAIDVVAPPGTICNPVEPGACAARGLTGFRMGDACFGALAQALPDRIFAASDGGHTGISVGGFDDERKPFIYVDFFSSAWGGRPWSDGLDGNASLQANVASQPAEYCERENPIRLWRYEFIQDSGGPGLFRGGMSVRRDYEFTGRVGTLQVRSDRREHRPYGLAGGSPGRPSLNTINTGTTTQEVLPTKFAREILGGTTFSHEQAGAGGWGDPLQRDPLLVCADVRNELVSIESALNDYGVVIKTSDWTVSDDETAALRRSLVDERSRSGVR